MNIAIIITVINVILASVSVCTAYKVRKKVREQNKHIEDVIREDVHLIKRNLELRKENKILKEQFKSELYNGAFAEWELVKDTEGKRDFYLEKDGIRLIFDDKKCIGWYKPNTYEAPTAEVIE